MYDFCVFSNVAQQYVLAMCSLSKRTQDGALRARKMTKMTSCSKRTNSISFGMLHK